MAEDAEEGIVWTSLVFGTMAFVFGGLSLIFYALSLQDERRFGTRAQKTMLLLNGLGCISDFVYLWFPSFPGFTERWPMFQVICSTPPLIFNFLFATYVVYSMHQLFTLVSEPMTHQAQAQRSRSAAVLILINVANVLLQTVMTTKESMSYPSQADFVVNHVINACLYLTTAVFISVFSVFVMRALSRWAAANTDNVMKPTLIIFSKITLVTTISFIVRGIIMSLFAFDTDDEKVMHVYFLIYFILGKFAPYICVVVWLRRLPHPTDSYSVLRPSDTATTYDIMGIDDEYSQTQSPNHYMPHRFRDDSVLASDGIPEASVEESDSFLSMSDQAGAAGSNSHLTGAKALLHPR